MAERVLRNGPNSRCSCRSTYFKTPLLLALATGYNAGRIIFHRGAYSLGMRAVENFSVLLPLSGAAIRVQSPRPTSSRLSSISTLAYLTVPSALCDEVLYSSRVAGCELSWRLTSIRGSLPM